MKLFTWKSVLFCFLFLLVYIVTVILWLFFSFGDPLGGGGIELLDILYLLLLLLVIFIVSAIVARRWLGSARWAAVPPFLTLMSLTSLYSILV